MKRTHIGGSDLAAIAGLHPYKTAMDVYAEQIGLDVPEAGEPALWGVLLEAVILKEWRKRRGIGGFSSSFFEQESVIHPLFPRGGGTIDMVVHSGDGRQGVEVKTVGFRSFHRWSDGAIPDEYEIQVQWYAEISKIDNWLVVALLGGQELIEREVKRNPAVGAHLLKLAMDFENDHILPRIPPDPDHRDGGTLSLIYPGGDAGEPLSEPSETFKIAALEYDLARDERIMASKDEDKMKNLLKHLIGDRVGFEWNDEQSGGKCTWKKAKNDRRTFRLKLW